MPIAKGRRAGTYRVTVFAQKRQHEWVFEGTKAAARSFEASKRLELGAGRKLDPSIAPTFYVLCTQHYRPYAETHLGADTWRKVRIYQVATLASHFGPLRLDQIKPFDFDEYKALRGTAVSATAVNNELRVMRAMLNWAKSRGIPTSGAKIEMLPVRGAKRVQWWTRAEVDKLYAAAAKLEPGLVPMLTFLLNTGCRKGEALAAEWSWVDLDAGYLRIPVTAEWQPKSKRPREVPLADALKAVLAGPHAHERWIFPSSLGERYASFPKEAFWRVREAAGLEGGPHTTRHTYAAHFLQKVPDMFLLANVLGHSHSRTTELYSHLLPEHLAKARNAVNLAPKLVAVRQRKKG